MGVIQRTHESMKDPDYNQSHNSLLFPAKLSDTLTEYLNWQRRLVFWLQNFTQNFLKKQASWSWSHKL